MCAKFTPEDVLFTGKLSLHPAFGGVKGILLSPPPQSGGGESSRLYQQEILILTLVHKTSNTQRIFSKKIVGQVKAFGGGIVPLLSNHCKAAGYWKDKFKFAYKQDKMFHE